MKNIIKFQNFLNENIEDQQRLDKEIVSLLNKQIENELFSSQLYRSISCWLDSNQWIGGVKLFTKYADEELNHMRKIYEYLFDKNCDAVTPGCSKPSRDFKDIRDVLEQTLKHEMEVTENWNSIADKALSIKDNDTYTFAQWFINEQREEETKARDILFKINQDMPKYEIDFLFEELAK